MRVCQQTLHRWGCANAVPFGPGKESMRRLGRRFAFGPNFTLLCTEFDCPLLMDTAVHTTVAQCSAAGEMRLLLRTQRYHTDAELIMLFKSHIVSYLEFRTAALAHAA